MSEPSDADLMARAASGEKDAFGLLVDRHKDGLVNFASRMTGCRDRGRDIAQETFLRLYRARHHYREQGAFAGYLYRIAANLVRQQGRRERRWRLLTALMPSNHTPHGPHAAQAAVLREEAREHLTAAVANLPLRYREPLVLHELEGWSYRSIAESIGCREGTVKSRINRGRGMIRAALAPYYARRTAAPAAVAHSPVAPAVGTATGATPMPNEIHRRTLAALGAPE
jgi:RNA polymerase sigma-70 factor (ECF subfamily)